MPTAYSAERRLGRRTLLKMVGLTMAAGVLPAGTATASQSAGQASSGRPVTVGDGTVTAYTEYGDRGLSAIGLRFDAGALDGLPSESTEYAVELPDGDTRPFDFVGLDYNPHGHEPAGLYGFPHFDFHFYMIDQATVEQIPGGTPTYDIPGESMPTDTYTTADLPQDPTPRMVVPAMGEHLISVPQSLPIDPGSDGWSVFIWGAYDPNGDGVGELTFMEPMITTSFLRDLVRSGTADIVATTPLPMPSRFATAGSYPTTYVVRYHRADETFTVSLESFEQFAG